MADLKHKKKKSRTGPFLRWAGGKRRLAPLLIELVEEVIDPDEELGRFIDPFLGGGAIPFALIDNGFPSSRLMLSDINRVLVDAYRCIQSLNPIFLSELERIQNQFDSEDNESSYSHLRSLFNSSRDAGEELQAARFLALNTTSFNGLWRENFNGDYNVPFGRISHPLIFDLKGLTECSRKLLGAEVACDDFNVLMEKATEGDVVFLDPPYIPLTATSSFSAYHGSGFGINRHKELASGISKLLERKVEVVLCNSLSPLTLEIYGNTGLNLNSHFVGRSIAADGGKREDVEEVIATSFDIPDDVMRDFYLSQLN